MSSRRSSRLANATRNPPPADLLKPANSGVDHDIVEPEDDEDEDEYIKPRKKRQKKSTKSISADRLEFKNVRGRRGALKDIVDMPLDILHEIFMYLNPIELLYLSRMCKALRRTLMTRSAEFVWRQARLNIDDLPNCPEDLNEPQYASLLFRSICDYCNERKARYFMWSHYRRCCRKCIDSENGMVSPCIDFSPVLDIIASIDLRSGIESRTMYSWNSSEIICEATAIRLLAEHSKLEPDSRVSWLAAQKEQKDRRISHGRLCETWMARQTENRASYLDDVRERRYKAVLQRLVDLGWEEELKYTNIERWASVRQPKDLTDRIWANIKDGLVEELKERKAIRLEEAHRLAQARRRSLLISRLRTVRVSKLLCERIFPPVQDLLLEEPFSSLIMAPTSEEVEFTDSLILEASQKWRLSKDKELRDLVIGKLPSNAFASGVDILSLATTFFKCWKTGCRSPIVGYPEVLVHGCATELYYEDKPWNFDGERVIFDDEMYSLAKTILKTSGLDPKTTSREEAQQPGLYFECHNCTLEHHQDGERILMTWHTAIYHAWTHSRISKKKAHITRAMLSNVEQSLTRQLEVEKLCSLSAGHEDYACVRCQESPFIRGWYQLINHIMQMHKEEREIGNPVYLVDYDFQVNESGLIRQPLAVLLLKPSILNEQTALN